MQVVRVCASLRQAVIFSLDERRLGSFRSCRHRRRSTKRTQTGRACRPGVCRREPRESVAYRSRTEHIIAGSLPSRATLANRYRQRDQTIFFSFPPSRDTYTLLSFCATLPFSPSDRSIVSLRVRPLYPSRCFVFFHLIVSRCMIHLYATQPREYRGCVYIYVCARPSVSVFTYAWKEERERERESARALRGCVGRVSGGAERKRLVSW